MIKKTLYFGNPAYLSLRNKQLVIRLPEVESGNMPDEMKREAITTVPIEDIGVVVLDNKQITITQGLVAALLQNTTALITCDDRRMPTGLFLPLQGNTVQNERFRSQLEASQPLRKQLWQQTVRAKIENQAAVLRLYTVKSVARMYTMADNVKSGDSDNFEAQAAVYYWKNVFTDIPTFIRDQNGEPPNNLLNYGYAILRAVVARALVSSGLLPVYGIHHHNRYNPYCLADDIMEPYRRRGYAEAALGQLAHYALSILHLHQLYAVVAADNEPALKLFRKSGFSYETQLRDWLFDGHNYADAVVMQRFL